MAKKTFCDICASEIKPNGAVYQLYLSEGTRAVISATEVCIDCADQLKKYMSKAATA